MRLNNLLIVCVGNICRSPMAEYLLRAEFESDGLKVHSAGLGALVGQPAHLVAQELMAAKGIDISAHRAKQLDEQMINAADLVLTMESWQTSSILELSPLVQGRVYRIGEMQAFDVADPYRRSREEFVHSLNEIERGLDGWKDRIRAVTV